MIPLCLATGLACGDADDDTNPGDASGGDDHGSSSGGSSGGGGGDASSSDGAGDADASSGGGDDGTDAGDSSGGSDSGAPAIEPQLPAPTGACPAIVDGDVEFAPAGMPARAVRLYLGDDTGEAAPLLFYWHATGSAPAEAEYALGGALADFGAHGGIVVAPHADPSAGTFEWFIVNQSSKLDDFLLADEIVACLAEAGRIDPRRIHTMGMSAGALQTTAFSFMRSDYLASVATYSGGLPAGFSVPDQQPDNPFAALIFFGGASDLYGPLDFAEASANYGMALREAGRFAPMCDHGGGHTIPLDAAPSVLEFFAAHPFGTDPSPYAAGLPASFPDYCALPR
jgi:predicted esterase